MNKKTFLSLLSEHLPVVFSLLFALWITLKFDEISKYQLLGSFIVFCAFLIVYYLIPSKWNLSVFFLFNSLYYFYQIAQRVYFMAFGEYFRLGMVLSMKSEIEGSMESIMEFVKLEYFVPLLFLLIITILFFFFGKKYCVNILKYRYRFILALVFLSASVSGFYLLKTKLESTSQNVDSLMLYQTDYYTYYSMPSTTQFVNAFGFSNLFIRDIEVLIQTSDLKAEYELEIEEYLSARPVYPTNELTGLFEGKSLLFVQAESLMNLAIDETLTPTLYRMMNEGISVYGYNSPLMAGSTSSTEMLVHTSLFPLSSDGYNASMKYMNNTYPKTLTKYFSNEGYPTYVFHNNYAEFYSRDIVMMNYGYDMFFDCAALGIDLEYADSAYFDLAKWILLEKEQFMAYWITFNGHQPYDLNLQPEVAQYISLIEETYPNLPEKYVSYMAKNVDLDRAIQYFLDNLSAMGKLDDVVIVLCGDHLAKGLQNEDDTKMALYAMGKDVSNESIENALRTPLTFFLPSLNLSELSVKKISNSVDILPTICNLWGFEAHEFFHLGFDIFDKSYSGFCFDSTDTYSTDSFSYNYVTNKLNNLKENFSEKQAMEVVNDIMKRFDVSKHLLEINYFQGLE